MLYEKDNYKILKRQKMIRSFIGFFLILLVSCHDSDTGETFTATYHNDNSSFFTAPIDDSLYSVFLNDLNIDNRFHDTVILGYILNESLKKTEEIERKLEREGKIHFVSLDSVYCSNRYHNYTYAGYRHFSGYTYEFYYSDSEKCKAVLYNEFKKDTLKQVKLLFIDSVSINNLAKFLSKKYGDPIRILTDSNYGKNQKEIVYLWIKNGFEMKLSREKYSYRFKGPSTDLIYTDLRERKIIENKTSNKKQEESKNKMTLDSLKRIKIKNNIQDF